ncbi:VIT1/CCC1 transporter family protein [Parasphaerochaeta coccoides]|uniref:Rubrerythrin diiron-binding domain-containing protein n=1 Tax=Parasphaerochaeta coccoides (strain ATCC BAA-1237 / DSM 17374 / SPN1) TaxID=760011 RepID=F4GH56_PARC1|nr:VIT1/CCC1 transporter family protein [Parasphaerochaeta coccoides]AEC01531.1 protein of unknown function DUF125 transmembrane [Parasphaerochaeta coccoides DSM 17374]
MGKTSDIPAEAITFLKKMQRIEADDMLTYAKIGRHVKDQHNKAVILKLAKDEERHAHIWTRYTGSKPKAHMFTVYWNYFLSFILGFTFIIKKMEKREDRTNLNYHTWEHVIPEARTIADDEEDHERQLLEMLDEERLRYLGSFVLGLSDALVELSGTLAGLTLALTNTRLIALSGMITGIAATLSMAGSEYLSKKNEDSPDNALKSSLYTGAAYLVTVALLILPYLLLPSHAWLTALIIMLATMLLIIIFFTYYVSVAKSLPFFKRFIQMAGISLSVAAISFGIGFLVKGWLGVDI